MQHLDARLVAEGHALHGDPARDRRKLERVRRLEDGRLGLEERTELGDRRLALLERVVLLHQKLDGLQEPVEVEEERDEGAEAQGVVEHHAAPHAEQRRLPEEAEQLGARAVHRVDLCRVVVGVPVPTDDVAVPQDVVPLAVVRGHDAHALQALGEVGEHEGDPVPHLVVAAFGRSTEPQRQ